MQENDTRDDEDITPIFDGMRTFLRMIGENPSREGLRDTPRRVLASWDKLYGGYKIDVPSLFRTFSEPCDEMVVLRDIEFYSTCLAGSTFIETPAGRIPISRLKNGDWVYCFDEEAWEMTVERAVLPRITGKAKQLWRVYTDKDTILCTSDHKFLTHDVGWLRADELQPGHSVVALQRGSGLRGTAYPSCVERTDWFEDVWCMDVPNHHNFVANGMVVHNCEHHLLPFFGKAHIAYLPNRKVVGVSKLARLLEAFARRLQIQERICQQVTGALDTFLQPYGSACVLEAQHFCMTSRGVEKQNSVMVTSSLTGAFKEHARARIEFLQLIGK